MPDPEAPQVTVRAVTRAGAADVLEQGTEAPRRSSGWLLLGLAAVLVVAVVAQRGQPLEPSRGLSFLETGGTTSLQWRTGGQLDVRLPLVVRNDGDPVVVSTLALERSSFFHPATDIALATGGRLPMTLRRVLDCRTAVGVPGDAVLRMTLRRGGQLETRRLALPEAVVTGLRRDLQELCRDVPLSQALVLRGELERVRPGAVELEVRADDISGVGLRLVSLEPASGLRVTTTGLPADVGEEPVVLRVLVEVEDCDGLFPAARDEAFAVGDVQYGDARGDRAFQVVRSRSEALHDLVERSC